MGHRIREDDGAWDIGLETVVLARRTQFLAFDNQNVPHGAPIFRFTAGAWPAPQGMPATGVAVYNSGCPRIVS
jgi:hypothetical protein